MKYPVFEIIPLGEVSVTQAFHSKYLNGEGVAKVPYKNYAKEAHIQLNTLDRCLKALRGCVVGEDEKTSIFIGNLLEKKRERVFEIKKALKGLEDGTLVLHCEVSNRCSFNNGSCKDLREEKHAIPEAVSCAEFRKQQGRNVPIQQVVNA